MALEQDLAATQRAQDALKERAERKEAEAKKQALELFEELTTQSIRAGEPFLAKLLMLLHTHPSLFDVKFKIEYNGEDKRYVQPADKKEKTLIDHLLYRKSEPKQVLTGGQIDIFHKNIDNAAFEYLFLQGAKITESNAHLLFDRGYHQELTGKATARVVNDFARYAKTKGDDLNKLYKPEDLAKILSGLGGGRSDIFTQLGRILRDEQITQDEYKGVTQVVATKLLDLLTNGAEEVIFIQPLELLNKKQTILHLAVYANDIKAFERFSFGIADVLKTLGVSDEAIKEVSYKAITQKNGDNKTPQELARSLGYNALAEDIRRHEDNHKPKTKGIQHG